LSEKKKKKNGRQSDRQTIRRGWTDRLPLAVALTWNFPDLRTEM
jgi:hypothetical protein